MPRHWGGDRASLLLPPPRSRSISPQALPWVAGRSQQGGPGLPGALWISSARLPRQAQAEQAEHAPSPALGCGLWEERFAHPALRRVSQESGPLGQPRGKPPPAPLLGISRPLFSTIQLGQRAQEGSLPLFILSATISSRTVQTWGFLGGLHPHYRKW